MTRKQRPTESKDKNGNYIGAFLLKQSSSEYFIRKLKNKYKLTPTDTEVLRDSLINYAYNSNFTQYLSSKDGKIYKPEKFQLLLTVKGYTSTGGDRCLFYKATKRLKELKIIEKRTLKSANVKRYFVNVDKCWELYNKFVQVDTASALWLKESHKFEVNTLAKLRQVNLFKEKFKNYRSKKTNIVPFTKTYEDEIPIDDIKPPWDLDLEVNNG